MERTRSPSSFRLKAFGTHAKEASETAAIVSTAVEVELPLERLQRNSVRRIQQHERLNFEAVWECVGVPDRRPIVASFDDFERAHPTHDASQVAEQNVSGDWLPLVFLHRFAKAAHGSTGSAKREVLKGLAVSDSVRVRRATFF